MRTQLLPLVLAGLTIGALPAAGLAIERTPAPDGAAVSILSPADGDVVASPFTVQFGLAGMGVAPAGVEHDNTGHHHLLINVDELPSMSSAIPADDNHRHFGGGQTQVTLELPPGEHTLRILLGDWQHLPHDPPIVSEPITITVQ